MRLSLRRGPVTVELSGRVPSPQAPEAVIRILRQEVSAVRPEFLIDDQLRVWPYPAQAGRRTA